MNSYSRELVFVPKKCRLPWCPSCGVAFWGKVRSKVSPHLHLFKKARLFTLTIDPKNFNSGLEAFEVIERKEKYIKRLLQIIGFKKAFKVLAFHKPKASRPDGNEWPHWHIVVDLADVDRVDLKQVWRLWRDKWKVGGLDLQIKRTVKTASAAVNYCISYCQHQSGVVAEWVKDMKRAPRAFECYGALRKAVSMNGNVETELDNDVDEKILDESIEEKAEVTEAYEASEHLTSNRDVSFVGERLSTCDSDTIVMLKTEYRGYVKYEFIGEAGCSVGQLALASKFGHCDIVRNIEEKDGIIRTMLSLPLDATQEADWILDRIRISVGSMLESCGVYQGDGVPI
jgi:hypothetical protein